MANFDKSFARTLKEEGGYVNDPADKGGETKYGIAKRYHPNVDIKNLTVDGAKAIYLKEYWTPINGSSIASQDIADSVYDFAVNAGTGRALSFASKAAQISGVSNWRQTTDANSAKNFNSVFGKLRIAYHESKAKADPSQAKFLQGWKKRASKFFSGSIVPTLLILATLGAGGIWLAKQKH